MYVEMKNKTLQCHKLTAVKIVNFFFATQHRCCLSKTYHSNIFVRFFLIFFFVNFHEIMLAKLKSNKK